jgi:hypothetical protein
MAVIEVTEATHWVEKWAAFVKTHERIILTVLVLGFGAHMYGRWIDLESAKKDAQVAVLTQTVAQDKATAVNLAQQASTAASQYQAALDSASRQVASLTQALKQESALLAQSRQTDAGLDMPALATRLDQLTPGMPPDGVTVESNGLALSAPASHAVVAQLEAVPVLTNELTAAQATVASDQTALQAGGKALDACQAQVTGLNTELKDQQAHETAAVAAEKLKTKKAWRSGFKWGFGLGFAAGAYIVHAL